MSKKIKFFLAMLVVVISVFAIFAVTASAEEKNITISYMNTQDTTNSSTDLDKVAYPDGNGKQTVIAGEAFTLPITANSTYVGQEGYVLVWYTENGRTYKAGETVSFTEDTKLFRCAAKEVSTLDELTTALKNNSICAILTADIDATSGFGVKDQDQSVLILNGHTINISYTNSDTGTVIGNSRSGKHIYGSGTINIVDTNQNNIGKHAVFQCQSHSYNGHKNKTVIGVDVTINASNFRLVNDSDVAFVGGYPWVKIYGKVNVYSFGNVNSWNRQPRFEIFEGAEITIASNSKLINDLLDTKLNSQSFQFTISGGTFYLPEEAKSIHFWTNDYLAADASNSSAYYEMTSTSRDNFNITGGSFNVKLPDGLLKNGYECLYNSETKMYDVAYVACTVDNSNGEHDFVQQEVFLNFDVSCTNVGLYYFKCECGSSYVDEVAALGHDYSLVTIEKVATTTENGIKRTTCSRCADSYTYEYSFDPTEQLITITVKTESGEKDIAVTVKDVYEVSSVDGVTSFTGIKSFTDPSDDSITYTSADIVKLVIPAGFTSVPAKGINNMSALKEIVLLDGANITFATGSITNCASLESLTAGECNLVFQANTVSSCANFATIDITNANATFESNAFKSNTAVKHLLMSSGHTYNFGTYAFASSGLVEVILPDDSTVTLSQKSFAETTTIEYVYIGKNCIAENANGIVSLGDDGSNGAYSIFGGNAVLSKVVMMDIEYVAKWIFSVKTSGNYVAKKDLYIYCHNSSIEFHSEAVNDRTAYNVYIYVNEITTIPSTCNYVIYKGIPHAYTAGDVESTCTAMGSKGYVTDCPCGVVADATYTVEAYSGYTGSTDGGTIIMGETTPALGHEFDVAAGAEIVSETPATCIKDGFVIYKCARCDETQTIVQEGTATGHTPSEEWVIITPVSCLVDGFKQKTCTVCNTIAEGQVISATGHTASGVWVTIAEASCTVGATNVQYCINEGCGDIAVSEITDPNGHTESGAWEVVIQATCTTGGEQQQSCSICNVVIETQVIDALGHDFDVADGAKITAIEYAQGFNANGTITTMCARCNNTSDSEAGAIFTAKGYSISDNGMGLNGGYTVNSSAFEAYQKINGNITYGIVIANANSFGGASLFNESNIVNSAKAIQVAIDNQYSNFDCSINFNSTENTTLELVITAYVIDEDGKATFIQAENGYATVVDSEKIAEGTFTSVTLSRVAENVAAASSLDAILPSDEE